MRYKTIVLELLQDRPNLLSRLRAGGILLSTLEHQATALKDSHESWVRRLGQAKPGSDPDQIASEALELALEELRAGLPEESPPSGIEEPSLDGAMAFLRRHTPPA